MKFQGSPFLAFFVCLYATLSPPFFFSAFTPILIRASLEIGLLFMISAYLLRVIDCSLPYKAICVWLMLFTMTLLVSTNDMASHVASTINIILFLLIIRVGAKATLFIYWLRWYWVRIWWLASVSIIIAFFVYQFNLIEFSPFDLSEIVGSASYIYYNNIIFGNLLVYRFFDFVVPKLSWYIYEPGILSFFLGLNILIAEQLFLCSKKVILFKISNLIAGIFTFSTTFYLFFIAYFTFKIFMLRGFHNVRWSSFTLTSLLLLWFMYEFFVVSDLAKFTSIDDRFVRLEVAQYFIINNSFLNFMFGNGVGVSVKTSDMGISSGILSILVERGILIFLFLLFYIYKYTKRTYVLLGYIIFYHITFELIWYPIFYIAIALNLFPIISKQILKKTYLLPSQS
jgi:hypothetical protein